jgi:hypothetical protein
LLFIVNEFSLALHHILKPLTYINSTVTPVKSALAMSIIIDKCSLIIATIFETYKPGSLALTFDKLTFVASAVDPKLGPCSVETVILEFAYVLKLARGENFTPAVKEISFPIPCTYNSGA